MSSFAKATYFFFFFSKTICVYDVFNDQSFNDTLTNDIVSFEQLGSGIFCLFYVPTFEEIGGAYCWAARHAFHVSTIYR